jgi:predicted CoA-binding protein
MLNRQGIPVIPVGNKEGEIDGIKIQTGFPMIEEVDTVTLYIAAKNQPPYYNYILSLKPERIIFNPGAENPDFEAIAKQAGIEVLNACTLTMLSVGNY